MAVVEKLRLPVRGLTFDVNGTLLHAPRLGEVYAEVLGRHGLEVDPGEVGSLARLVWQELDCSSPPLGDRFTAHPGGSRGWWRRFLERLCEHLEVGPPGPFAAAELFERFARPDAWELFPEVRPTLARLQGAGLPMAVVSNWDERLPGLLEGLGLAPFFVGVVHSSAVGVEKPHPRIFQQALELLGAPAAAVLHVGDRRREDREGALAAGMQALHLDRRSPAGDLGDLGDLGPLPGLLGLPEA